jgi:hypothetical protein
MSITSQPEKALAYLGHFAPAGAVHCIQTFDEGPARDRRLARTLHGTLDQLLPEMTRLNLHGAGVFYLPQELQPGTARKSGNVARVRALFADCDDPGRRSLVEAEISRRGLVPSFVVETSPGKYHYYWLTSDCPLDAFKPMQRALATALNTDPTVCDLPRVMRLPGFIHRKGAPFLVCEVAVTDRSYSYTEMRSAYPFTSCTRAFSHAGSRGIARTTSPGDEASPQAVAFRRVLDRHGGSFSLSIPVAIQQAKQGERYGTLRAIIARLAAVPWPIADIRAALLPHMVAAWRDTPADDLRQQVDYFSAWVLAREAEKTAGPVSERGARLALAFGAGR